MNFNVKRILLGLEKEIVGGVGKKRKVECESCLGIINKQLMKKHLPKCQLYMQLVIDGNQCKVCGKKFVVKGSVNQHIG